MSRNATRLSSTTLGVAVFALLTGGCTGGPGQGEGEAGTGDESGTPVDPETVIDEARETLPDYLSLHTQVVARTCSPDEGVCHHAKEYPDLTTAQSMLSAIGVGCNLAVDDPQETFNGCERKGDRVQFLYGQNDQWSTEIAWVEPVLDGGAITGYRVHLRDAIPEPDNNTDPDTIAILRDFDDGETVDMGHYYSRAVWEPGARALELVGHDDWQDWQQALMADGLRLGDPNRDGEFGADGTHYLEIAPGEPERSYLLGRLLGAVPGTPMPLANQPLSSAEVIAMTCWIEGLDPQGETDVYATIDYDNCEAAANFGASAAGSGHSFVEDVQPILARCTAGGCHDAGMGAAGLDLESEGVRDRLLQPSTQDPMTPRVVPGNPTNSYLMIKLRGKGVTGLQMPRTVTGDGEPLSEAELDTIEAWIVAGAPAD